MYLKLKVIVAFRKTQFHTELGITIFKDIKEGKKLQTMIEQKIKPTNNITMISK